MSRIFLAEHIVPAATVTSSVVSERARSSTLPAVPLTASRYFVYYTLEPMLERVVVRAVWHMSRRRGPRLK